MAGDFGRRLFVATTNLDAGRRVVWNMGAIAARGEEGLRLFRDVLLASSSIPGFFSPVPIEVEANGKKFHELHGDGTLTAPFFVVPETMLSRRTAKRRMTARYYTPAVHRAAFALPGYVSEAVAGLPRRRAGGKRAATGAPARSARRR